MATVTSNINQARAMRIAVNRIEGFAKQFGETHRNLARHAAFPLALTPDLLYQIWANFVPEAPWTAVAHVLLSRLCRQVGYEMYEMDIADRNLLLRELKGQFGQERLDELGEFLLDYVTQRLTGDDPDIQDLAEAQEWTALAYTKPDEAARQLAEALSARVEVKQEDITEVLRLTSLVETFAEPLIEGGFEPLLIYSRGMANFVYGKQESATALITPLLADQKSRLRIAGVNLPIPSSIVTAVTGAGKQKSSDILINLYNAFDPFRPLPAGDPNYVDCRELRGDGDILEDLGNRLLLSNQNTCLLYSGHRGARKSTELLRLKGYLEQQKFYVVYFAADEEDIQSEDAQYTDILLACTRHLLEELNNSANPTPLLNWVKKRCQELKDLAQVEISFENLNVEEQIAQFAKLIANLRAEPMLRRQIREVVEPHTVSLINILNEFLKEAKQNLPNGCIQLAMIVDNLDRIVPFIEEDGRTNHAEIFLDRSEQLKALDCHLVYMAPLSMVCSNHSTYIREIYSDALVLPMIMVWTPSGELYQPGINKIKEIIGRRVNQFAPNLSLDTEIFDSPQTLEQLCLMSGGHVRNLLLLTQDAVGRAADLPISERAVRRAITQARDTYRRTVDNEQWRLLAEVSRSKRVVNDDEYRSLLFNRCLLEYRYLDDDGEVQRWFDVHPLIREIKEFKEALAQMG
jgi:hypothetical protein